MGKTKTAFVSDLKENSSKGRSATGRKKVEKPDKVHISGQKGGESVKLMEAAPLSTAEGALSKKSKKARVRGKKYLEAKKKVDRSKLYSVKDAIALAKETSTSAFDGTIELHLVVRKEDLSVKVDLPHATGKTKKVEVASDETIKKLQAGKVDFDILLATADIMPKLVPFARILGPKGLLPNPKNGTLIKSAKDAEKFNAARVNIKTEKKNTLIHTTVGKVSMKDADLQENLAAIINAVNTRQIVKAYLVASMGPSVKLLIS